MRQGNWKTVYLSASLGQLQRELLFPEHKCAHEERVLDRVGRDEVQVRPSKLALDVVVVVRVLSHLHQLALDLVRVHGGPVGGGAMAGDDLTAKALVDALGTIEGAGGHRDLN
jgi:hypothetical protein